jgi:hypothetical protein
MAISKPRNRVVLFRLTQDEFNQIQQACTDGAARSVSDYARARILGLAASDTSSLAQLENKVMALTRAVEHLTNSIASPPRADAATATYGSAPYLAKSGD